MMQISTQSNSEDRLRSLRASQVLVAACLYFIALGLVHATGQPPHIIFIYTDDHARWATGAYGSKDALTPHIDRIGREGALFERAFVTTPVCSPSRAGLLTSQYSFRTGITDFIQFVREPELGLSPQFVTWPQLLRQRGYHTAIFGKWHLGLLPESSPVQFGYDTVSVFASVPGGSTKMDPIMVIAGVQTKVTGFGGDIITDAAIDFLKENAQQHPVLISLHLREPHVPYEPVPEIDDKVYRDRMLEEIPNHPQLDQVWAENTLRSYYKSVASIDRNVGRLLNTVDRLGLAKNTVVIYTSDHGYMIGHNGVYGKGTATIAGADIRSATRRPNLFDNAIRVPLLIRWPAVISPGTRIEEMVTNLDFFPTFLAMADAQSLLPDDYPVYGHDFTPLLRGENIPWRTVIFGDYDMYHYVNDSMRMIRTEDWKLVLHTHLQFGPELYYLRNDPGETINLANSAEHFGTYIDLRRRLFRWQEWMGDPKQRAPWKPQ